MSVWNSLEDWGGAARFFHWATALLIVVTMPIGWLANSLEQGATERALFDLHFQVGVLILVLVIARLLWRMVDPAPQAPSSVGTARQRAAKFTHFALYMAMLTMIGSGYMIQMHMRPSLEVFGLIDIARPIEPGSDQSLRAFAWYVHTYGFWLLVGLLAMHVVAALWHHFFKRDNVLRRMLPFRIRAR